MDILTQILTQKRQAVAALDRTKLEAALPSAPPVRDFLAAVTRPANAPLRLIAELKIGSPSRGVFAPAADLQAIADEYAAGGAAAVSVITEEKFFHGSLATLQALRARDFALPLLRKDFIIDARQILEARVAGADAVLLIVAALPDSDLHALHALARALKMTVLVEIHTAAELTRARQIPGLQLLGLNHRDLTTFEINLEIGRELAAAVPPGVRLVAESGLFTAADCARLAPNVDAILVGEALLTAPDRAAKLHELTTAGCA